VHLHIPYNLIENISLPPLSIYPDEKSGEKNKHKKLKLMISIFINNFCVSPINKYTSYKKIILRKLPPRQY